MGSCLRGQSCGDKMRVVKASIQKPKDKSLSMAVFLDSTKQKRSSKLNVL